MSKLSLINDLDELFLTGSRAFATSSINHESSDWDFFGIYNGILRDVLEENDFTEMDFYGESRLPALTFRASEEMMTHPIPTTRWIDVILFLRQEDFDFYLEAHNLAAQLQLRDRFETKKEFSLVFCMMCNFNQPQTSRYKIV